MFQSLPSPPPFYRTRSLIIHESGCAAALLTCLVVVGVGIVPAAGEPVASDMPQSTLAGCRYLVIAQEPVRPGAQANRQRALGDPPVVELPVGSRIVVVDTLSPPPAPATNLTPGFAAAGQPDLSFDGERILFAGKQGKNDPLNVWEMNVDGTGLRQITRQSVSCYAPIYLSTIFTLDADKPVYQIAFSRVPEGERVSSLYTCHLDGTRIRRITFNPYGASDPFLISDKRLLYTSWNRPEQKHIATGGAVLTTVNTDGTDVFIFCAPDEAASLCRAQCETAKGWVVYVEAAPGESGGGGSLVAVARTRSLHTRRVIADDPNGLYRSASILDDGKLLASYRPKLGGSYGLYELDAQSGARIAEVFDTSEWHEVEGIVVQPRSEPAGHSSVVDERVNSGKLYCMNTYLSDTDKGRRISEGQIKRVRVIQAVSSGPAGQSSLQGREVDVLESTFGLVGENVLGEASVEPDGSFFLEVPARTPLRLETLDNEGRTLQAMTSWVWVMPQERRGCVGCHEDRELTPPNRHVYALRKEPIRLVADGDATVKSREKEDSRDTGG